MGLVDQVLLGWEYVQLISAASPMSAAMPAIACRLASSSSSRRVTVPSRTDQNSLTARSRKYTSWLTTTTAPANSRRAVARTSTVSMSRWFVGSSRYKSVGSVQVIAQRMTLDFCPPLSLPIGSHDMPSTIPNCPRRDRISASLWPGNCALRSSVGVRLRSSCSTKCWAKSAERTERFTSTEPRVGASCWVISFSSVDLPQPLAPKIPTLEPSDTERLTLQRRTLNGAPPLAAAAAAAVAAAVASVPGSAVSGVVRAAFWAAVALRPVAAFRWLASAVA
mmetsp:Transcript_27176/g.54684  ORF Transcript_27176/g.54684 Transcript_27176/m.54684 type:complete len:279 (+) Transcript_27176:391-1227(+)